MSRADRHVRFWLHVLVLALVLVILFPFLWLLMMSFKTDSDIFAWPPVLFFTPTLDHYLALWQGNFPKSFANSAIASIVSTVLAMLAGVPMNEAVAVGGLIGQKIVANEFVAYVALTEMQGALSERSTLIATYALCGFANFSSIAIQIGGIGGISPSRRAELAQLGLKAVLGGTLVSLLNASWAGILVG